MTKEEIKIFNPDMVVWDGLDEAIIGVAKKEKLGPFVVYDMNGEVEINLDKEAYSLEDEEDTEIDSWGREEFGPLAVYNINKIIDILKKDMEVDEDSLEDGETIESKKYEMALEYFEFNIGCAYVGIYTPVHIYLAEEDNE